ncbi:hypothetical protein GGI26_006533 [Coemansia sp. RSA 1358]|nr:hypothetical protein GGI26_006533 [Coemansia sp. RSA 1358]
MSNFSDFITDNFHTSQPGHRLLRGVAEVLHSTLFFNKTIGLDDNCKGSIKYGLNTIPEDEDDVFGLKDMAISNKQTPPKHVDPFVERMKYAKEISEQLLEVLKKAVKAAKKLDK